MTIVVHACRSACGRGQIACTGCKSLAGRITPSVARCRRSSDRRRWAFGVRDNGQRTDRRPRRIMAASSGRWRVIVEIGDEELVIIAIGLGPRSEIYRERRGPSRAPILMWACARANLAVHRRCHSGSIQV